MLSPSVPARDERIERLGLPASDLSVHTSVSVTGSAPGLSPQVLSPPLSARDVLIDPVVQEFEEWLEAVVTAAPDSEADAVLEPVCSGRDSVPLFDDDGNVLLDTAWLDSIVQEGLAADA